MEQGNGDVEILRKLVGTSPQARGQEVVLKSEQNRG
jgi:hypothetical protein